MSILQHEESFFGLKKNLQMASVAEAVDRLKKTWGYADSHEELAALQMQDVVRCEVLVVHSKTNALETVYSREAVLTALLLEATKQLYNQTKKD